jgi:hypothetical protein
VNDLIEHDLESILPSGFIEESSVDFLLSFSDDIESTDPFGISELFLFLNNIFDDIKRFSSIDRPFESFSDLTIDSNPQFGFNLIIKDSLSYLIEFESSYIPQIYRDVEGIDPFKFTVINPSSFLHESIFSFQFTSSTSYVVNDLTIDSNPQFGFNLTINDSFSYLLEFHSSSLPHIDREINRVDPLDLLLPSEFHFDPFSFLRIEPLFHIPSDSNERLMQSILDPSVSSSGIPNDSSFRLQLLLLPLNLSTLFSSLNRFSFSHCNPINLFPDSFISLPPFSPFDNLTLSFLHNFLSISRPSPSSYSNLHIPLIPSDTFGSRPFSFISLRSIEPLTPPSFDITNRLSHIQDLFIPEISPPSIPDFPFDSTLFLEDQFGFEPLKR